MPKIILGLGSNVGDRAANLQTAIGGIKGFVEGVQLSAVLESAALLPEGAPKEWDVSFLNMAVMAECRLAPAQLLTQVKQLETTIGRVKHGHWSPREIDIDILAYGEEVHILNNLQIPHPYLLERDFALLPFAELWPEWKNPAEGEYQGWFARDIAADKNFGFSDALKLAEVVLHG